jgi:hypothetical protein
LNIFLFAISGYELELDSHAFEKNKTFIRSSSAVQIARDSETLLLFNTFSWIAGLEESIISTLQTESAGRDCMCVEDVGTGTG